jgi:N-methylhydantoinase B
MYSGYDKPGEWYQLFQIGFGGIPGRPMGDGPDGHSLWPGFTNVPNEYIEAYFPLRIEVYETIADSGGPGFNRGGNGIRMGYRFLEDGQVSIHDDRWLTYPWGVNGGLPGGRGTKVLVRADGTEALLPSKCDRIEVKEGDILYFNTWGGGGAGDPFEREPARVGKDVERGLVSVAGARRYGIVCDESGNVDEAASEALRAELRASRSEVPLFDFGGTVEEIKSRCKEETGLDAPVTPVFAHRGSGLTAV